MQSARPLILFDGVCNLCNAWVQWVIRRDPKARFHFASLQSEAGRSAVSEAGGAPDALPDSVVLLDDDGLHVRSSAALRVLRSLGFPYLLFSVFFLVPTALRDLVYGLIARHRYAWFGRRDACMMPTPALRARFLDADEPRTVLGPLPSSDGSGDQEQRGSWLRGFLLRFSIVYVVVYMLPFPLSLLGYLYQVPGVAEATWISEPLGTVLGLYDELMQGVVEWVGGTLFGLGELSFAPTGSGDTTVAYLDLLVDLALALVVALVWAAVASGRRLSAYAFDGARVLARYYLATTMLTYGWIKLFPLQFPAPGPDRLLQSYGDSSPMGLAWTFLGASAGYQMLGGLMELVGGYLLFWRRTTFLGALVVAGVMANVAAINFFYDVPVKLFSLHLILVALFLAAPDLPRLVGSVLFNVPTAARVSVNPWPRNTAAHVTALLAKTLVVLGLTVLQVRSNAERHEGTQDPSPLRGIYRVESFTRAGLVDRANEDEIRWVRVGLNPPWVATIQRATGEAVRMRFVLDEEAGTLSFYDRGGAAPEEPQFRFEETEPGLLRLEGSFEEAEVVVLLRRQEDESLLRGRGFHWINEYPFNR